MISVTIRILEGMEQGKVYSRLKLPVTIGREEENDIQLNDDHVSRFHAKLQSDSGRIILTDLESTNGTKVNGHWIQMRILRVGDIVSIGRCVLLLSDTENDEVVTPAGDQDPYRTAYVPAGATVDDDSKHMDFVDPLPGTSDEPSSLFPNGHPELPSQLTALQQVQLSDLLSYLHERIGVVVKNATEVAETVDGRNFNCDYKSWSKLVRVMSDLSEYINQIHSPD